MIVFSKFYWLSLTLKVKYRGTIMKEGSYVQIDGLRVVAHWTKKLKNMSHSKAKVKEEFFKILKWNTITN